MDLLTNTNPSIKVKKKKEMNTETEGNYLFCTVSFLFSNLSYFIEKTKKNF